LICSGGDSALCASLDRGEGIPHEEILRESGFDADENAVFQFERD
jgi:hypothetical protein